jgi:hypothetical protein
MKCQFCQRKLDNRFQAIYSTRLDRTLAFCPFCYANALTNYFCVCTGCLTTYWLRSEKTLNNFTFAYQNECDFCLEKGLFTERIIHQWGKVWKSSQLLSSPSASLPTGCGGAYEETQEEEV